MKNGEAAYYGSTRPEETEEKGFCGPNSSNTRRACSQKAPGKRWILCIFLCIASAALGRCITTSWSNWRCDGHSGQQWLDGEDQTERICLAIAGDRGASGTHLLSSEKARPIPGADGRNTRELEQCGQQAPITTLAVHYVNNDTCNGDTITDRAVRCGIGLHFDCNRSA